MITRLQIDETHFGDTTSLAEKEREDTSDWIWIQRNECISLHNYYNSSTHRHSQPAELTRVHRRSEELAKHPPPNRPAGVTSPLLVKNLPVDLAATRVDVDVRQLLPGGTLPYPANDVEKENNEQGQVGLEETLGALGSVVTTVDSGVDSGVEL
jgi:hypothetical protein